MKSPKHFTFEFKGHLFKLPIKFLETTNYNGEKLPKPKIDMNRVSVAKVIKQYVKSNYPNVVVRVASESYSGGSSTNVYICDKYGDQVSKDIFDDVKSFADNFKQGSFDGMYDIYNYRSDKLMTDNGHELDCYTKYIFVSNRPKFDTPEHVCNEIKQRVADDSPYSGGPVSYEKAVESASSYNKETVVEKGIKLYKESQK